MINLGDILYSSRVNAILTTHGNRKLTMGYPILCELSTNKYVKEIFSSDKQRTLFSLIYL